jgi:putative copper resistance protein D
MYNKLVLLTTVTFLHDLFTAIWIGGLIMLGLSVIPSIRNILGMGPQSKKLISTIQRRQSLMVYVSILGLVLTGLLHAKRSPGFQGFFAVGNTYSLILTVKHVLILAMVGIALFRSLTLGRNGDRASPSRERLNAWLLYINIGLGVAVLLLSGVLGAISTMAVT